MTFSNVKLLDGKPESYDGMWLSVSKMKTFEGCRLKYKYTYIDRLPRKDRDYLIFGKFLHDALERFHKYLMSGNTISLNLIMKQAFTEAIKQYSSKITSKQKIEAYEILKKYLEIVNNEFKTGEINNVLTVEEPFFVDLDGQILLNGLIDKIQEDPDEVLHVKDYKTSKSSKWLAKDLFQLKVYAYVKFLQDPGLQKVRGSYVMLKHDFECVPKIPKEFTRDDILGVEEKVVEVYNDIKNEKLWRATITPLCHYCDHNKVCKDCPSKYREEEENKEGFGETSW
jgi:RecB family exonuclease